MKNSTVMHAVLWAAAILSGALMGADTYYVTLILPVLAAVALGLLVKPAKACKSESI